MSTHHHRRLLEPPEPFYRPTHLDKTLSIAFATAFCITMLYLLLNSLFRYIHRQFRRQPSRTAPVDVAEQDPARRDQLRAIAPVLANKIPSSSSSSTTSPEPESCPICLAEYEGEDKVRVLPRCKHMFHKDCIDRWLITRSSFCPMCRERVIEGLGEPVQTNGCRNSYNYNYYNIGYEGERNRLMYTVGLQVHLEMNIATPSHSHNPSVI